MAFEKTWRWFGEKDTVSLAELKQIGIEGIVTALHHIPNGEVWPVEEIMRVKNMIESYGMKWSVVESLPVSEGIKIKSADRPRLIKNYQESLRNLGKCGIDTVCYNFMPVLDWVRTDLHYKLPSGGEVMYFDFPTFVAFDAFILKRPGAENDYPKEIVEKAREKFRKLSAEEAETLAYNIIVVTQGFIDGAVDGSTPDYKKAFLSFIDTYKEIDRDKLRQHLGDFLKDVVPVAEESGVRLAIHPDDPPFPVLGLPRIASTKEDFEWIVNQYDSISNGVTFCTGSLSVRSSHLLVDMVKSFGHRIHFLHLRNNVLLPDGCFHEYGHIHGCVDMYEVVKALLVEQKRRMNEGRNDFRMPVRPDHGIKMLDDYNRSANPGYPLIGRMKGLAELTGLEMGIERML
ncbi:mannonate dehydratase [Alkalitalea saponilacus]|uniref:Mannonate dehydratase n=1 Tax=Alkalitalea saponilacus TaxID=889453 RepID=A0A1T5A4L3_9BACT|nr:mannonate dehydratase [Alkalitalea saponilacus]ASB48853.1 mannonate dehydratase [Alkalitalea saponilacus]SKB29888.1 mannonate dehydratase [Alkalitalea saponilacus]